MKNKEKSRREALENIEKLYKRIDKLMDYLPDSFPKAWKDKVYDTLTKDNSLNELINSIKESRPPRIMVMGRTGVGKSSLINAILGSYYAPVSDVYAQTRGAESYIYKDGDRNLIEILDTRGLSESIALDESESAEKRLSRELTKFMPDLAIFMLSASHRDDVSADVDFLKNLIDDFKKETNLDLPVVVVINKVDELAPSRIKNPLEYPESKQKNIVDMKKYYGQIIEKGKLKIKSLQSTSSLIDWKLGDKFIDVESIEALDKQDKSALSIGFDGRYGIDQLIDILEETISDKDALMGLRLATRIDKIIEQMADNLINVFATLTSTIAVTPIPVADIYPLIILQSGLIYLLASLGGEEISIKASRDFIFSLGSIGGAGIFFRFASRQLVKLLFPAAGSLVSAGIAAMGTKTIGKAGKSYYIDGIDFKKVKKVFKRDQKKNKKA
ncbi:MAG: 50S ribosome-binding GTPase [Tissierellia bacterium]|nr:50S ribosome-binding GTPase [Tissierellia bacterium]